MTRTANIGGDRDYETLLLEQIDDHVLLVTLNRPQVANAFNTRMAQELTALFEGLGLDAGGIRVLVATGAGNRAFCAGGDLRERRDMSDEDWSRQHLVFERMIRALVSCPIPVVGAINGAAYGGGCEIAATFDFLYAAETARFCLPETGLGIIPGAGGTQTVARAIGERRAKEMILTARPITARQAFEWGMVNAIYPQADLLEASLGAARAITENAPIAVRQAKQSIHKGLQMSLHDGLAFECEAYYRLVPTRDRKEGVLAYNQKRKPEFKGR